MAVTSAKRLGQAPNPFYRMGMSQGPTHPEHLGEAELVVAMKRGEDAAYEQFVRQFGPRLLAVAKRILRDENAAQDAFQEAMVSALRNIESFEGNAKLSTWMHRIVVNAALMRLRKQKRLSEVSIDATVPGFKDDGHRQDAGPAWERQPIDDIRQDEREQWVHEAIARLPETHRGILLMRDIEQMTTSETAAALKITEGAVKVRLHRARQALRELLDPHMRGEAVLL